MHWTACYNKQCQTHVNGKDKGYYPTAPKEYCNKKAALWTVWKTLQPRNRNQDIKQISEKEDLTRETILIILEELVLEKKPAEAKFKEILYL